MTDDPAHLNKREFQARLRRAGLRLPPADEAELFAALEPLKALCARVHREARPATCDPLPIVRVLPGEEP
jgi:hypothetical protein